MIAIYRSNGHPVEEWRIVKDLMRVHHTRALKHQSSRQFEHKF